MFVFLHAKLTSPAATNLCSASIYTLDSEDFCWKVGHMTDDDTAVLCVEVTVRSHDKSKLYFNVFIMCISNINVTF